MTGRLFHFWNNGIIIQHFYQRGIVMSAYFRAKTDLQHPRCLMGAKRQFIVKGELITEHEIKKFGLEPIKENYLEPVKVKRGTTYFSFGVRFCVEN